MVAKKREEKRRRASLRGDYTAALALTPPNLHEPRCTSLHPLPTNVVLARCIACKAGYRLSIISASVSVSVVSVVSV